jgi:uncharacterized damage-inducible protein DinB
MSRLAMLRGWKSEVDAFTMRLAEAFPEALADFRASAKQFTVRELLAHLAESEYEMAGDIVRNRPIADPRLKLIAVTSVTMGRLALKDVHQSTDTLLRACAEEDLDKLIRFPETETTVTVAQIVRTMIEHQLHHRGQLITYLRMNDCLVPLRWQD